MRALGVVAMDEPIEAPLLLQGVGGGGPRGVGLQGEMHPLMAPVLLRVPGRDALEANAETEPPDREFTPAIEGVRGGERDAVVGADRLMVAGHLLPRRRCAQIASTALSFSEWPICP